MGPSQHPWNRHCLPSSASLTLHMLLLEPELARWGQEDRESSGLPPLSSLRPELETAVPLPEGGHLGSRRWQGAAGASQPRLKVFPFLTPPRDLGAGQKDLSLSQAQNLHARQGRANDLTSESVSLSVAMEKRSEGGA